MPSGCGNAGAPVRQRRHGSTNGLVKNEPALQVSWSAGIEHHALAAAQPEHRLAHLGRRHPLADLDAERPGQLGVLHRRAEVPEAELERHRADDEPAGLALEQAGAVAEAAVGVRAASAYAARAGRTRAPGRSSRRPPGRRRRRSGSGWPRPCRGCRTAPRHRSTPRDRARDERVPVLARLDHDLGARRRRRRRHVHARTSRPGPPCRGSPRRRPRGCCRRRARARGSPASSAARRRRTARADRSPRRNDRRPAEPQRRPGPRAGAALGADGRRRRPPRSHPHRGLAHAEHLLVRRWSR